MLGSILIITGLILTFGALLISTYLVSFGCAKVGAANCDQSYLELVIELMKSSDGAIFWAAIAAGLVMISVGHTIKTSRTKGKR